MFSDAPPCLLLVTTSETWRECMDVKTFTNSGMIAPASVPQVMIVESFHHIVGSPGCAGSPGILPSAGIRKRDTPNVSATDTSDVSHTRLVSGCSKLNLSEFPYLP